MVSINDNKSIKYPKLKPNLKVNNNLSPNITNSPLSIVLLTPLSHQYYILKIPLVFLFLIIHKKLIHYLNQLTSDKFSPLILHEILVLKFFEEKTRGVVNGRKKE